MKGRPSVRVARAIRGDLALAKKLDRSLRGLESDVKTTKAKRRAPTQEDWQILFGQRLERMVRRMERKKGIRPPPISETILALPTPDIIPKQKRVRKARGIA